jgi:hypothetical protein
MAIPVVIIVVPSQGKDTGGCQASAVTLNKELYGGNAVIVKTTVAEEIIKKAPAVPVNALGMPTQWGGLPAQTVDTFENQVTVSFNTLKGNHPFRWENWYNLSRVVMITHGATSDGPNLAYKDPSLSDSAKQPWGTVPDGNKHRTQLSPAASAFWSLVGKAVRADGMIILLGCNVGRDEYALLVSELTKKNVYAPKDYCSAGNPPTALKQVKGIESQKLLTPMMRFTPK